MDSRFCLTFLGSCAVGMDQMSEQPDGVYFCPCCGGEISAMESAVIAIVEGKEALIHESCIFETQEPEQ